MKRKKKRKGNRVVNVIIMQDITAKPLNLMISKKSIKIYTIIASLLVLLFVSTGYLYVSSLNQLRSVDKLKKDNMAKAESIDVLNQEMQEINKQQEEISRKQEEIKKLMGLKESEEKGPGTDGGQGGQDVAIEGSEDSLMLAQQLKFKLSLREKELDDMLAKVRHDQKYFLAVPNQWPIKGRITSPFGMRKSPFGGSRSSFHDGIDIANKVGTEVVAAADGEVIYSGWKAVYGKTILIDHGYGFVSKYGHNSALLVTKGDKVKKGQPIARVGNTGRSTGPHLHFTILKNGDAQDPMIYLP